MYLSKICIRNFRCFGAEGVGVDLQPGVNVIIGENNTGKSAFIDALRLAFSLGPGRREIYVTPQDFHLRPDGEKASEIAFDLTFNNLTPKEEENFYEMWVVDPPVAQLHLRYRTEALRRASERIRTTFWGGTHEGQSVSSETLEYINHIFLGALRDAERHLRPGRASRIGRLLRSSITQEEDRNKVLNHVRAANRAIMEEDQVKKASITINTNLSNIEGSRLKQHVRLGFAPPDFGRIVDSLRPLLPQSEGPGFRASFSEGQWSTLLSDCSSGADILQASAHNADGRVIVDLSRLSESEQQVIDPRTYAELLGNMVGVLELDQNGMGYNNIIYIGTVLGDLQGWQSNATDSYNALLIEEPEAHLHPQLQDLVLGFLNRVSTSNNQGPIQLVITTHSPTLTSQASLDELTMLYKSGRTVKALPLGRCPLEPSQKADLKRYLDVTKAQLFFAKGVVLVEGISEALLLPPFARRLERRLDHNAVEVINVAGTSFAPFACLFNSEEVGKRIDIPCGILTDDDRCTRRDDDHRLTDEDLSITFVGKGETDAAEIVARLSEIHSRMVKGLKSHRTLNAEALMGGNLIVRTAYKTFEYELAAIPENVNQMLDALQGIHPKVANGLRTVFASPLLSSQHKAICLWLAIRDAKAEFAQRLAALIDDYDERGMPRKPFTVPSYIEEILKHVAPVETPLLAEEEHEDSLARTGDSG